MQKIQGYSNLYKTPSGAIVNTDYTAYTRAKERKREKEKINNLEQRLDKLESLLTRLLEHVDKTT